MKIKVSSNHLHLGLEASELACGDHRLRCDWSLVEVDAMIGFWEFTEEFLSFKGPKVFYCCEPTYYFRGIRASKRQLRTRLATLRQDEFAWHFHDYPEMCVVHHNIGGNENKLVLKEKRRMGAAAVLGNLGHPLNRNAGRQKRLKFIVDSRCDIFGLPITWEKFQLWPWSRKGAPSTYRGPCDLNHKIQTLAGYHACICLENSSESLYFTEKFPDAVRAGCVPIYHAHESVKKNFLEGAVWVDPADHRWDPVETLSAAMSLNRQAVDDANRHWMATNENFAKTFLPVVYDRLSKILVRKIQGSLSLPAVARR
jgi:hypothetical protein